MRCDACGKFRKKSELSVNYTPDTPFEGEDIWLECEDCKEILNENEVKN